jgi:hypothetical protein
MRSSATAAILALAASAVLAEDAPPLPKVMRGTWTAIVPHDRAYTDALSVTLDESAGAGALTGRLTLRGVTCGAIDEPLTGTWDGAVLRMESVVRPNTNAQRMNGQCGSGRVTFVLKRKPGQPGFEGESTRDGASLPSQIVLAP